MPFGSEIAFSPDLSPAERIYVRLFGAPILGLRIRARSILPFLECIPEPKKIVDAGCGKGMIALACARRFPYAEVIGVDLNETQNRTNRQVAEMTGITNIRYLTMDVMKLSDVGRFDLIVSTDMLEHLENDLGGVKMFLEALEPEGHLLVHVPHLTRNTLGWRRANWMDVEGHVRPGYTKEGLTDLLNKGGFSVKICVYNYNSLETLANDISKWITGAKEQNRGIYAAAFPFLLFLSYMGSFYRSQKDGSGLIALAVKEK